MVDHTNSGKAKRGVRDAIILILSTGFVFGFFMAFFLNQLLPLEQDEPDQTVHMDHNLSPEEKDAFRIKTEKVSLSA